MPWIELSNISVVAVVVAVIAGALLGFVFFVGLWATVRALPQVRRPAFFALASFLARTAAVLIGFYLLVVISWKLLVASLVGFVVSRLILTKVLRPQDTLQHDPASL